MNPIKALTPLAVAAALLVTGCGSDSAKTESIQKQATEITERGANVSALAAKLRKDVAAGTITQAEADKQIKAESDAVIDQAKDVSGDAIDLAQEQSGIPDEAKKALEDAQEQIEATP